MKPGRELDVLVHEKVMGFCAHGWAHDGHGDRTTCSKCGKHERHVAYPDTPRYSTDMGAAWAVVEKFRVGGSLVSISAQPEGHWFVNASKALNPNGDGTADGWDDTYPDTTVRVASPAHGICLVAVDHLLDEADRNEFLVDCLFCGETQAKGHAPDCTFLRMRPDIQEEFRKVGGVPRGHSK